MITSILHRRRLLFWLFRAYLKKRKRTIFVFFIAGIVVAIVGLWLLPLIKPLIPTKTQRIGVIGSFTVETLPIDLQNKISLGLTRITENGEASSSASISYDVSNEGKTYTFVLRNDLHWQDGKALTANDINYNFRDVTTHVVNDHEMTFTLKEPYAPFPIVASQPLFRKGLIGLSGGGALRGYGEYKVVDLKLNGTFITHLTIEGITPDTSGKRISYKFYPNDEIAKTAFMLGEIDVLTNLLDASSFENFKNVEMTKTSSSEQMTVIFYNTSYTLLSDKNVRQALTYALSREFDNGVPSSSPINRSSWAFVPQDKYTQNINAAKNLLDDTSQASQSGALKLTLSTTPPFSELAQRIKKAWEEVGIETNIEISPIIPSEPQVLLERIKVPVDPDQYILWHSTQTTNISRFANPKIDKLLEDGRQTVNLDERSQIYAEFQRYIVEESPAAFLYYPNVYTVSRK